VSKELPIFHLAMPSPAMRIDRQPDDIKVVVQFAEA
jgi:hypothetical protein